MFSTAIPFGTPIIYLLLFGGIAVGGLLLLAGFRRRIRALKRFGAVFVTLGVGLLVMDLYLHSRMEWNPQIANDEMVAGIWEDERETITLHADHRVDYHSWNEGFTGTWSRNDWNLRLKAEGVDSHMRFVRFNGELRLMTFPPDDPDLWNGIWGLKRSR